MIVKILAGLKDKFLYVALVALSTLLLAVYFDRGGVIEERDGLKQSLAERMIVNERLVSENKHLLEQLKTAPKEAVVITKEVMKEVCTAQVKSEAIKAIPSNKKDGQNEANQDRTADIDDRLPAELIRLLN